MYTMGKKAGDGGRGGRGNYKGAHEFVSHEFVRAGISAWVLVCRAWHMHREYVII